MFISTRAELRITVEQAFGARARCLSALPDDQKRESGTVQFLLYDSLIFLFALAADRDISVEIAHKFGDESTTNTFLGHDLSAVENTKQGVQAALEIIARHSALRFPDEFLEAYDAL